MQHAVFAKGPKEFMDAYGTRFLNSTFKHYMKRHKGYKALNKQVQLGNETGIMYFNLYKCPRFAR